MKPTLTPQQVADTCPFCKKGILVAVPGGKSKRCTACGKVTTSTRLR